MKKNLLSLMLIMSLTTLVFAEDWTNAERLEKRDAAVTGTVKSISRFADLNGKEELLVAEVVVEEIIKTNELVQGKTIQVFFLNNQVENTNYEGYVNLKEGQRADFYLDARPLFTEKEILFINLASDVQAPHSL